MKTYDISMDYRYGPGYLELLKKPDYELVNAYLSNKSSSLDKEIIFNINEEEIYLARALDRTDIFGTLVYMPLFSLRFVRFIEQYDDFEFKRVSIKYNNNINNNYFLPKIKKQINFIDLDNSIITGNPFTEEIKYQPEKIPDNTLAFYSEGMSIIPFYTENFIKIIKDNKIDIDYDEIKY